MLDEKTQAAVSGIRATLLVLAERLAELKGPLAAIESGPQAYRVDGVVLEFVKFCDTWGVEAAMLVRTLREAGVPVLSLEREYRMSGEGQLRTRIQAFLETMGK